MVLDRGKRWEWYSVMQGRRPSYGGRERVKAEPGLDEQAGVWLTVKASFNKVKIISKYYLQHLIGYN